MFPFLLSSLLSEKFLHHKIYSNKINALCFSIHIIGKVVLLNRFLSNFMKCLHIYCFLIWNCRWLRKKGNSSLAFGWVKTDGFNELIALRKSKTKTSFDKYQKNIQIFMSKKRFYKMGISLAIPTVPLALPLTSYFTEIFHYCCPFVHSPVPLNRYSKSSHKIPWT